MFLSIMQSLSRGPLVVIIGLTLLSNCNAYLQQNTMVKSGQCPAKQTMTSYCATECTTDWDCSGGMKCCGLLCGGAICTPPVESTRPVVRIKPGQCPAQVTAPYCFHECFDDFQCPGQMKCCRMFCGGHICKDPRSDFAKAPSYGRVTHPAATPVPSIPYEPTPPLYVHSTLRPTIGNYNRGTYIPQVFNRGQQMGSTSSYVHGFNNRNVFSQANTQPNYVYQTTIPPYRAQTTSRPDYGRTTTIPVFRPSPAWHAYPSPGPSTTVSYVGSQINRNISGVLVYSKCPLYLPADMCVHECKGNQDCHSGMLCCRLRCGGAICQKPTSPPGVGIEAPKTSQLGPVKNGMCPGIPVDACIDNCKSDGDCPTFEKCCKTRCGTNACMFYVVMKSSLPSATKYGQLPASRSTPVPPSAPSNYVRNLTPKTGRCPAIPLDLCVENCKSDSDCPDLDKCCPTKCGKKICSYAVVMKPTPTPRPYRPSGVEERTTTEVTSPKTGYCPMLSLTSCTTNCQQDSDCSGNDRCCQLNCGKVCIYTLEIRPIVQMPTHTPRPYPVNVVIKDGECPSSMPHDFCVHQCQGDNDCSMDMKCCNLPCGGYICQSPRPSHQGYPAPIPRPQPQPPVYNNYKIGNNLGVLQLKGGRCPAYMPRDTCVYQCNHDSECDRDMKCCTLACGGKICQAPSRN